MASSAASIGKHVVHGSAWLYGRHVVTNVFNVFVVALLARKLSPADFGVIALATVILRFLTTLGPIAVGDYIIYDRESGREERVQAAFWLNLALTLSAVTICLGLVPFVSRFFGMPSLNTILYLLLVQFAVGQLASVPDALLRRALDFKRLALRETVFEIINGAAMVGMALNGFGIWSLVFPSLILTPLRVIVAFKLADWIPALPLRKSFWPGIFRYSCHSTGAGLVTLLANEGDTLVIGKRLSATDLGFYNQAWSSANLVNRNVTGVVAKVAMPALSAVSQDIDRLRAALNRMMRLLALTSFPLLVCLFVVADLFVVTIYGPKWRPSILPMQILIVFALRQTIGSPSSVAFSVVGRPDIALRLGLVFLPFYCLAIWLGSHHGIVGVAVGVTAARTSFGFINFYVISRFLRQSYSSMLTPLARPLFAAVLMGLVVYGIKWLIQGEGIPHSIQLVILACSGAVTWILLLAHSFPDLLEEAFQVCELLSLKTTQRLRLLLQKLAFLRMPTR